jgi:hypothetical protein
MDTRKEMGRIAAELMPEFVALRNRLRVDSPNVRRAVADALSDWAHDPAHWRVDAHDRSWGNPSNVASRRGTRIA